MASRPDATARRDMSADVLDDSPRAGRALASALAIRSQATARQLVSSRQHPDTPIAKHHENLIKAGRHAELRIDGAIGLQA
jgi:hypothetical protein